MGGKTDKKKRKKGKIKRLSLDKNRKERYEAKIIMKIKEEKKQRKKERERESGKKRI